MDVQRGKLVRKGRNGARHRVLRRRYIAALYDPFDVRRSRRRRSRLGRVPADTIAKVDPRRLRVTKQIKVGHKPWDVAYGFGSVWSSDSGAGTVSRINPRTLKVVKRIQTAATLTSIRAGAGAIWVGSQYGDDVYRINPATNAVAVIHVGRGGEVCVDPHDDGVWVSDNNARSVTRLDATTGVIVATTKVGTSPSDGVRGPDGLKWIRNDGEGTFWRIDAATNAVVDTISVGPHQFVVRSAFGDIWVGEFQGHRIWRIHP